MKNKHTATITWIRYFNFGSYLQAYGLQQSIFSLGYDNKILSDILIDLPAKHIRILQQLLSLITMIVNLKKRIRYEKARRKTAELYCQFRKRFLSVEYVKYDELKDCDSKYDQYICGSDQIWHPCEKKSLNPFFYAGFSNKKKIAYAASFGVSTYPSGRKEEFIKLTSSFSHISCREKIGCKIVKEVLDRDGDYVLDPSLLLSDDKWRKISCPPSEFSQSEKYMLAYFLTPNNWYVNFSKQYAKKHNLKLISFFLRPGSPCECDETVIAGPSEFVWLIDHAELVLTDSFHGSIFSSILHTPFVGFCRFKNDEKEGGQNHRLLDLYKAIGVEERFIRDSFDCNRVENLREIKFEEVESNLLPLKQVSLDFLSNSLEK